MRTILDTVRSFVLVVDQGGIVRKVSRAVEAAAGFSPADSAPPVWELARHLYISAQRMHQGSLRVESESGQGACFIVDLPRALRSRSTVSDVATGRYA